MKTKFALYQGAVMCEVESLEEDGSAIVAFDNGETARVPMADLVLRFDLLEGCAERRPKPT